MIVNRPFPRLSTPRLSLRAFRFEDAPEVQQLAGDPEVAEATLLPHPYEDGMAEAWIAGQAADFDAVRAISFAIERMADRALVGTIGLEIDIEARLAKLGCWIGRPYWSHGYCAEAGLAVLGYGFDVLGLERIWAPRFRWNQRSARALAKLGFAHEGARREYIPPRRRVEVVELHGMLRWEWDARRAARDAAATLQRAA